MIFKCADKSDADTLVKIYNSAFYDDYVRYGHCPAYGHTREEMEKSVVDYPKIIAYDEDRAVGVISSKKEGPGKYYIGCLAVVKEEQGRGIGTLLMNHFMSDNERNVKFYTQRFGFDITGEEDDGSVTVYWFKLVRNGDSENV